MWGIPPVLVIFIGPYFRKYYLSQMYDTFLDNMNFFSIFSFINSIGFITLYNLELRAAQQIYTSNLLLFLGIVSFTSIDFTKFVYEDQVVVYLTNYC